MVLGVLALGLTGLKASGLTVAQSDRGHPDSVTGAYYYAYKRGGHWFEPC